MASLPQFQRVRKEDMKGSEPWIDPFVGNYNSFAEVISTALAGTLTFSENFQSQQKEITFTTENNYGSGSWVNISFPRTFRARSRGLEIIQILDQSGDVIKKATTACWLEDNGNIVVQFISGLENARTYFVRFLVF